MIHEFDQIDARSEMHFLPARTAAHSDLKDLAGAGHFILALATRPT